jgi:hypothetical protein
MRVPEDSPRRVRLEVATRGFTAEGAEGAKTENTCEEKVRSISASF